MKILSLQSAVVAGHVGNSAAVFPLQRLGFEVMPVDTVQFSNHPGHGRFRGIVHDPAHVRDVLEGVEQSGLLTGCRALLTGYLGDAAIGEAVLKTLAVIRKQNPSALYLCDPVMGEVESGVYVRAGIPEFLMARALLHADIVTPNRFELELLSGQEAATARQAVSAARALLGRGPKLVFATGIGEGGGDTSCIAVSARGAWEVRTPRLTLDPPISGMGDTLAAMILGHLLRGTVPAQALSLAVSSLYGILLRTVELRWRELALIPAQDEIVHPGHLFPPVLLEE